MLCLKNDARAVEILTDYCAGTLDRIRAAELEAHLCECSPCRDLADAQQRTWQALDTWKPVEVSPDFDVRLYARISVEARGALREPLWRRILQTALIPVSAAAAVIALALVMDAPERMPAPPKAASPAISTERIDLQEVQQALDDLELLTPLVPVSSRAM